jgi:vibriolysin
MMKKIVTITGIWFLASSALAFTTQRFHNDNADQALGGFQLLSVKGPSQRGVLQAKEPLNSLVLKRERTFQENTGQYKTSYYQYYQGIRVLDGEVTIHESASANKTRSEIPQKKVVGQLLQNIDINSVEIARLNTLENLDKALANAKADFLKNRQRAGWEISADKVNLVIKNQDGKLRLLYEVSFYATAKNRHTPALYHAFLDPQQQNKVVKVWSDLMHFSDKGPGGNTKTEQYHYGENGIPFLDVNTQSGNCVLNNSSTKLNVVDMSTENPELDRYYKFMTPFSYKCNSDKRDTTQFYGAFSAADDAYFFGHMVMKVYQDWYQTKVLDFSKITLRVHYAEYNGEPFDNAFWDPYSRTMNFGDGTGEPKQAGTKGARKEDWGIYPLVSLDITAHEMSHGFTSAHSDLQYHDESGALNESFSDMAGMVALAYMRETAPQLYRAIYHDLDMNWTIGSSIVRDPDPSAALRHLDKPSRDGLSADCYKSVSGCVISYQDLLDFVESYTDDEELKQGIIVHCGSGVFNRFFYLLSNTSGWDVRKAFNLMLVCNRDGYWTENSNFQDAACQTLAAAKALSYDTKAVANAFAKVGIKTTTCSAS